MIPDQNFEDSDKEGGFGLPVDEDSSAKNDNENDDQILSDDDDNGDVLVEQFTASSFEESLNFEPGTNNTNRSDNNINILLWIFKFQSRFCLPDRVPQNIRSEF